LSQFARLLIRVKPNLEKIILSYNQNQAQNGPNFITASQTAPPLRSEDNFVDHVWRSPGNISEPERVEIIQTGFQWQDEEKISLKKSYESTDPYSLF
jgi:hypothetical protein